MEIKDRNEAIVNIANIIANSVDDFYIEEKDDMINDLYVMGGQSQYLEDMLYNNGTLGLEDYIDMIDDGLSKDELGELAKLVISNLEKQEGKQEILIEEGLKIKNKHDGTIQDETQLRKAWEEELQNDLNDNETIEDRKKEYTFDKWVNDLLNTNDFEKLEESLELKNEDVEETLELDIEQANGSVEQNLEAVTISENELSLTIKSLMDCEKDKIANYNAFLNQLSSTLPKDVYEIIEEEINSIKENSLNNQELLNKIYNALSFILDPQVGEGEATEIVEIGDNVEDIFNSLKEEGKLAFNNMKELTEQYANYKGIEFTESLQKEVRKTMLENYSILEDKSYTLVSTEAVKLALIEEAKRTKLAKEIDNAKKEAEQNAKETGEDTYVYRSVTDGTVFFATQKPTHTALFNKALVLGKYKVGFDHGKVVTSWFEESKEIDYKYKKELNESAPEMIPRVPDGKEVESPITTNIVEESKEIIEEIGEDYEKISFEDYKKRNKEFIELCYANTWGEGEIDKDLYEELANSMYTDSITGNINTKEEYKSLNDRIEEADIETINDQK